MRRYTLVLLCILYGLLVTKTEAACTIPDVFRSSVWMNNFKGDIVFTTWEMKGWGFLAGGVNISVWQIVDSAQFDKKSYLALRARDTFEYEYANGTKATYHSFMCLKFERVNDIIYKYRIHHDANSRANYEKVLLSENDHLTRLDEICLLSFDAPIGEYGVLVKKDSTTGRTPKSRCPGAIIGRFEYTITLPDTMTQCESGSLWDGCKDNHHLMFNVTKCAYPVAYSTGGDLTCVANAKVGDVTYITVYNLDDTVDESTTYRFSCLVAKDDGLTVSVAPHGCQSGQLPDQIPTDRDGNPVGYTLVNEELSQCKAAWTIPDIFQSSVWMNNFKGDIVFTTWEMKGWGFLAGGVNISVWEIVNNDQFDKESYLALRARDTFEYEYVNGTKTTYYSFMCLKFERVNDIIYKYRVHHAAESRANNEKVLLSENDHLTRLEDICLPSFDASTGEYGVLVKKDSTTGRTPRTRCPGVIIGTFQYTITLPDTTTQCESGSLWDGCKDNRHLMFNVTKCAHPVAYSTGGDLTCVANAKVGDVTYITVYNLDDTVDESTTYRFSCLVAKDDGLTVSVAPHGCQSGQLPDQIPTDRFENPVGYTLVKEELSQCKAAWTIPKVFQSSVWMNNFKGDIVFTTWEMKGWGFLAGGVNISVWEIVNNDQFDKESYLALRARDTFEYEYVDGTKTTYHSFMCLKFERVNDIIYKYRIHHAAESRANNEKVLLSENDHLTRLENMCPPSFDAPTGEYGVLVKRDSTTSRTPMIQCPNAILGSFQYTITLPDDTTQCDSGSLWDGCNDTTHLMFNVTKCTYPVAYSVGGNLTCVANAKVGEVTYITVYNADDTVDDSTTYRFSCLVANDDGLNVSVAPHGCQSGQLPHQIPTDRFGNQVGYTIVNEELSQCRPDGSGGDDDGGLSVLKIVGISAGGLVLEAIITILIIDCIQKRS